MTNPGDSYENLLRQQRDDRIAAITSHAKQIQTSNPNMSWGECIESAEYRAEMNQRRGTQSS